MRRRFVGWRADRRRKNRHAPTLYRAFPNIVRHGLRYGEMISLVEQVYGVECGQMVSALLCAGISTADEVVDFVRFAYGDQARPQARNRSEVLNAFRLPLRYIVEEPVCSLELKEVTGSRARKRRRDEAEESSSGAGAAAMKIDGDEAEAASAASNSESDSSKDDAPNRKELAGFQKRSPGQSATPASEAYFEVNLTALMSMLHASLLIDHLLQQCGPAAFELGRAVVNLEEAHGDMSSHFNMHSICKELENKAGGQPSVSVAELEAVLSLFNLRTYGFVHFEGTHGLQSTLQLNLAAVSSHMRRTVCAKLACLRHGPLAVVIMNALLDCLGHAEDLELVRACLHPMKEVRQVLAAMLRSGMIHLREVYRSNDMQAQRTIFLWHIDMDVLTEKISDDLHLTVRNMLIKQRICQARKRVLDAVGLANMSAAEAEELPRLEDALNRLSLTLRDLERRIMAVTSGRVDVFPTLNAWS